MSEPKPAFAETKTGQFLRRPHKVIKDKGLQVTIWAYEWSKANPKKAGIIVLVICAMIGTVLMNIDDFINLVKKLTGLSSVLPGHIVPSPAIDTLTAVDPQ